MASADAAWVDVLPSIARFLPELRRALGNTMPQAGQQAGDDFGRGFTRSAVSSVEQASSKLAAARKKEADAAGAVRVAEAKLQDLRDSGKAKAAQLVAAEESLAKAKRNLDGQTDAVTRSTQQLTAAEEQAARGASNLDDGMTRAHRSGGLLTRTVGGLSSGMKLAAGALLGGGLIHGLTSLYESAAESAKIGRLTEQVIRSTGGAAQVTAGQVGDLATAISEKTGVDDEAIQSGENLLLTFTNVRNEVGKGNDVFNQASVLANDMSVALGKDMSSSALALGKALNDPIKGVTALQKVGVSFTAAQKDQIRTLVESGDVMGAQKIILAELGREFGGAAEAAGTPFDKLKVTLGNVAEEVGGYLIPAVSAGATFIMRDLIPAVRDGAAWVGDHFGPAIHVGAEALGFIVSVGKGAAEFFGNLPTPVLAAVGALTAFRLLSGPIAAGFAIVGANISMAGRLALISAGNVSTAGGIMAVAGGVARAGWAGFMTLLGGPLGLAITGVTLALTWLATRTDDSAESTKGATQAETELASALMQSKGAIDANVRAAAAKAAQDKGILDGAGAAGVSLSLVTDAILGQGNAYNETMAKLVAYRDAHTDLNGERTGEAQQVAAAITALQGLSGQTDVNITKAQQLATATSETATSTGTAVVAAQDWQTQLEDTATAASDAKQATDLLKTSLDILSGAHISMAEAEASFFAAVAQADGALKDMSGSVLDQAGNLNVQSEAGRAAQDVLFGIKDANNQVIATMIQQGATADTVNAKDAELRESFIKSAMQMGINRQAAENLANQILGIPAERKTTITADAKQATDAVDALQRRIDGLRGRTVDIIARAAMPDIPGVQRFGAATGAVLPGWSPGRDVHHFFSPTGGLLDLSGGEAVMRPEFTAAVGSGWVNSMNAAARAGGIAGVRKALGGAAFANGGVVGPVGLSLQLDRRQYDGDMDGLAKSVLKLYEPVTGFVSALQWVKGQVGRPYLWGGVGPTGFDCSGLQSAIVNVIRGRNPNSRIGSTASFPWPGFGPGGGLYTIGSTKNAGGGIGHMAGTLLGVNVESRGGQGVVVGPSARGANSGLFGTRAHLRFHNGGTVPDVGLPEVPAWLLPHERVLTPPEDRYFQRLLARDAQALEAAQQRPGEVVGAKFYGPVTFRDQEELLRQQRQAARRAMAAAGMR